jgi:predicted nucleic acid-binding protein
MSSIVMNSMNDKVFIDTNVLVYAFATIKGSPDDRRSHAAHEIVSRGGVISVQVLNEFVQVCRQKARLEWDQVMGALEVIGELCEPAVAITIETHETAVAISRRYQLHIYDSLILAAAALAGCEIAYSEDMQHGQMVGSVKIVNPFL